MTLAHVLLEDASGVSSLQQFFSVHVFGAATMGLFLSTYDCGIILLVSFSDADVVSLLQKAATFISYHSHQVFQLFRDKKVSNVPIS